MAPHRLLIIGIRVLPDAMVNYLARLSWASGKKRKKYLPSGNHRKILFRSSEQTFGGF